MKKLLILLFFNILTFSNYNFLNESFTATLKEISNINKSKKEKEYILRYSKDKVELEVLKPKLNAGEIYTYTKNKKTIYIPLLKQTTTQSISKQDASIYAILNELKDLTLKENQVKNSKEYKFENGILKEIIAKDYIIKFIKYENNKPIEISFSSSGIEVYYYIKY